VNFGTVNSLQVNAPIETFGQGARGFNVYTGTVRMPRSSASSHTATARLAFRSLSRSRRGIETFGGTGKSLVKGVVMDLSAIALSVRPGGSARAIDIAGGTIAHGKGISPPELHGAIDSLRISDGFAAAGGGFEKI
jgi:hypothetical protein